MISKCNLSSKSSLVLLVDLSTKWVPLHTIRVGLDCKQLVPHAGVKIGVALWHRTEHGTCTLGRSWVKILQMCVCVFVCVCSRWFVFKIWCYNSLVALQILRLWCSSFNCGTLKLLQSHLSQLPPKLHINRVGLYIPRLKFAFIPELISPPLKQTCVTLCHCKIQF